MNKCQFLTQTIKRMTAKSGSQSLLPSEYQQVEYLQSSGTQYIDLGYSMHDKSSADIYIDCTVPTTNSQAIIGCFGNGFNSGTLYTYDSALNFYYRSGNPCFATGQPMSGGPRCQFTINLEGNSVSYSDLDLTTSQTYTKTATTTGSCPQGNVVMFAQRNLSNNSITGYSSIKVYRFSVSFSSTLALDMYPCYRKSDNKPGMYDLVTGTFFTNSGSGEFSVGRAISANPHTILCAPFNGNFNDLSDNHYTLTVTGNPTFTTGYFDGTQAVVITNNNVVGYYDMFDNYGDFTVDFYSYTVRARDVTIGRLGLVTSANADYGGAIRLNSLTDTAEGKTPIIKFQITYNTWVHLAITRENNIVRAFRNGVLMGTYTDTGANVGGNVRVSSVTVYPQEREMRVSNLRVSDIALHEVNNGVYTFPVPTHLYTD